MPHVALPALAAAFSGHDVDFVFSVWDKIGRKIDGAMNVHQLERVFDRAALDCLPSSWFGVKNIWEALPELRADLEKEYSDADHASIESLIETHFPGAVVDVEPAGLLNLEFDEPREDKNSIRMLYKIWRANEICRSIESETSPYDVVFRVRPDVVIERCDFDHVRSVVSAGGMIVDQWRFHFCGDNFAAGSRKAMSVYASVFGRALARDGKWGHIHRDLYDALTQAGLHVEPYWPNMKFVQERNVSLDLAMSGLLRDPRLQTSAVHAVALASLQAAQMRIEGRGEDALATLLSVVGLAAGLHFDGVDGWLAQIAMTLHVLQRHAQAALVGLAVRRGIVNGRIRRGDEFDDCIVSALLPSFDELTTSPLGKSDDLVEWLAAYPDLERVLASGLGRPVLEFLECADQIPGDLLVAIVRRLDSVGRTLVTRSFVANLSSEHGFTSLGTSDRKHLVHVLLRGQPAPDGDRIEFLTKLSAAFPDDVEVLYPLADLLKRAGETMRALEVQEHAVRIAPAHGGARRQLAELLAISGDIDAALSHARSAHELDSGPQHAILLAYLLAKVGDEASARTLAGTIPVNFNWPSSYSRISDFNETMTALSNP